MRSWNGWWVLISAALLLLSGEARADKRVALVIGNSAYANATPIANATTAAVSMEAFLRDLGFEVIRGVDLSGRDMAERLREFGGKTEGADLAVLYYAGGAIMLRGSTFLLPIDADVKSENDMKPGETFDLDSALSQTMSKAKVKLAFIDASRTLPFRVNAAGSATAAGSTAANSTPLDNLLIGFATAPGETALDGPAGGSRPFTRALIANIGEPGVEIFTAMTKVRTQVASDTKDRQIPWVNSSPSGFIYLRPAPSAPR